MKQPETFYDQYCTFTRVQRLITRESGSMLSKQKARIMIIIQWSVTPLCHIMVEFYWNSTIGYRNLVQTAIRINPTDAAIVAEPLQSFPVHIHLT